MPEDKPPVTKPTLMFFSSEWCGNCKRMKPIIAEISQTYAQKLNTVNIDIAKNPDAATKYDVLGIPTIIILKDDNVIDRFTGFITKDVLIQKLGII